MTGRAERAASHHVATAGPGSSTAGPPRRRGRGSGSSRRSRRAPVGGGPRPRAQWSRLPPVISGTVGDAPELAVPELVEEQLEQARCTRPCRWGSRPRGGHAPRTVAFSSATTGDPHSSSAGPWSARSIVSMRPPSATKPADQLGRGTRPRPRLRVPDDDHHRRCAHAPPAKHTVAPPRARSERRSTPSRNGGVVQASIRSGKARAHGARARHLPARHEQRLDPLAERAARRRRRSR